jgi:hypothetical protein
MGEVKQKGGNLAARRTISIFTTINMSLHESQVTNAFF